MDKNYKFRGGTRIGILISTWPNGILEVNEDFLILRDELMKKELKFSKEQVVRIEIKKSFPIIGCSIRIYHTNNNHEKEISFGYLNFHFNNLINALKECDWPVN
jgi:hypothetical protein